MLNESSTERRFYLPVGYRERAWWDVVSRVIEKRSSGLVFALTRLSNVSARR